MYKYTEIIADAIVPTTKAPYVPEKTDVTINKQIASKVASPKRRRSYFHLITSRLKETAIPTIINSKNKPPKDRNSRILERRRTLYVYTKSIAPIEAKKSRTPTTSSLIQSTKADQAATLMVKATEPHK